MNTLSKQRRAAVIGSLVEGNSVRATVRMTGVAKDTVLRLLVSLGRACLDYQDRALRNLPCKRIQCDEIWSFVGAKEKNASEEKKARGWGDIWTWVALDADTKLVPSFMVGTRGSETAKIFMDDLASRLASRVQLTTDGHRVYLNAVEGAFGSGVDYAMLVKLYGNDGESEKRYSPAECIGCQSVGVTGRPDPKHISSSFVERQNLTMRMKMRRFTRLTNAFSKKAENHFWAIALHYMHYNFCRIHQSLRVTPAMEAGVSDHVWSIEEVVDLLDRSLNGVAA
ncbi:MAG: IS1 family transposase [Candidatus Acidiferrales bacterium]